MKRTALTTALLLGATLLGSQAFAASNDKDLCSSNLQLLKDAQVSTDNNQTQSPGGTNALKTDYEKALDEQKRGDDVGCIKTTESALADLKRQGDGGDAGSGSK